MPSFMDYGAAWCFYHFKTFNQSKGLTNDDVENYFLVFVFQCKCICPCIILLLIGEEKLDVTPAYSSVKQALASIQKLTCRITQWGRALQSSGRDGQVAQ